MITIPINKVEGCQGWYAHNVGALWRPLVFQAESRWFFSATFEGRQL